MNRTIKFRAWDKAQKIWLENESLIDFTGQLCWNDCQTRPMENIVLMQYTGLLDKNGKEIYEGDIVRATNKYNSTPIKRPAYEIVFEDGAFCGISLKRHSVMGKGLRTLKLSFDDWQEMETAEILGNIYEDSSLLGEHEK